MHNHVYGNTKGQTAPTSDVGYVPDPLPWEPLRNPSAPCPSPWRREPPLSPQGMAGNIRQLTRLIREGMAHEGFAFINVFSPCVTDE